MKTYTYLALCLLTSLSAGITFQVAAMESDWVLVSEKSNDPEVKDSLVSVRNDSNWIAQVNFTTKDGTKASIRINPGEKLPLKKAGMLDSITYHTYGSTYGSLSYEYPLEFKNKLKAGFNLVLVLTTYLQNWYDKGFEYEVPEEENALKKKEIISDEWDLLPRGTRELYMKGEKKRAYRLMLHLPEGYTSDDLKNSYRSLSLTLHPDKANVTDENTRKMYSEAMKLVNEANEYLSKELSSK